MNNLSEQIRVIPETSKETIDIKNRKRLQQQERRLITLGATDVTLPGILNVLQYLDDAEFSNAIPARDELYKRLVMLTQGASVPLVVFNCLDFAWKEDSDNYPLSRIIDDTSTSICGYFSGEMEATVAALQSLSPNGMSGINLHVIVPDSELFDERVFRYAQDIESRQSIGIKVKDELSQKLSNQSGIGKDAVIFWSEYCARYGLPEPTEYTGLNADRLTRTSFADNSSPREQNLYRTFRKQVGDSQEYLINNGLKRNYVSYGIPRSERELRTLWYCAMYMGEGQALAESNAISLNLEDPRVSKWFNIGSEDKLPILTPVNPSDYYQWRNAYRASPLSGHADQ